MVGAMLDGIGFVTALRQAGVEPRGKRVWLCGAGGASSAIAFALAEAGITPEAVTDVFISHLHSDHVGGLTDAQGNPMFPNAAIRISAPEWETLQNLDDRRAAQLGLPNYKQVAMAIGPDAAPFQPGGEVLPGMVRAVEVKGHTPGHSAFRIGSGANSLLYIADSLHHHVISVQKPEWRIAFDVDAETGAASRASLLEELATTGQRIYAVHFPFPGIGRIEKRDEGYVWVAEQ